MSKNNRLRGGIAAPQGSVNDTTDDMLDEAGVWYVQPQDDVRAVAMPATLAPDRTWIDQYYGHHHAAQPELYGANGDLASRALKSKAAGCNVEATVAKKLIENAERKLDVATDNHLHAEEHLRHHARRSKGATILYYGGMAIMGLGDLGGIAQPQVTYGEEPLLAIVQGASASVGMVMSGWTARALKDHHAAVKRVEDLDDLKGTEREKYASRFRDPGSLQRSALAVSAVIFAAAPLAVGLLRDSVDGGLWGIAFALFAIIACAGSFVGTYFYTDDIADLLDDYSKQHRKAVKAMKSLSNSKAIKAEASALSEAASIENEATKRGRGAQHHMLALGAKVKSNNGHAFGMGEAAPADAQGTFFTPADLHDLARMNGRSGNGRSNGKAVQS